jgi:hypothetical protein
MQNLYLSFEMHCIWEQILNITTLYIRTKGVIEKADEGIFFSLQISIPNNTKGVKRFLEL